MTQNPNQVLLAPSGTWSSVVLPRHQGADHVAPKPAPSTAPASEAGPRWWHCSLLPFPTLSSTVKAPVFPFSLGEWWLALPGLLYCPSRGDPVVLGVQMCLRSACSIPLQRCRPAHPRCPPRVSLAHLPGKPSVSVPTCPPTFLFPGTLFGCLHINSSLFLLALRDPKSP